MVDGGASGSNNPFEGKSKEEDLGATGAFNLVTGASGPVGALPASSPPAPSPSVPPTAEPIIHSVKFDTGEMMREDARLRQVLREQPAGAAAPQVPAPPAAAPPAAGGFTQLLRTLDPASSVAPSPTPAYPPPASFASAAPLAPQPVPTAPVPPAAPASAAGGFTSLLRTFDPAETAPRSDSFSQPVPTANPAASVFGGSQPAGGSFGAAPVFRAEPVISALQPPLPRPLLPVPDPSPSLCRYWNPPRRPVPHRPTRPRLLPTMRLSRLHLPKNPHLQA